MSRSSQLFPRTGIVELYCIVLSLLSFFLVFVSVQLVLACIDLTVSSDEDDVVCVGYGVDIKLELTKSQVCIK